jgi:hypothetical protein
MDMDIKTWAIEGSVRFGAVVGGVRVWEFDDFWKRSNTFHAFLRFVDAAEQRWGNDPALQQMKELRTTIVKENESYFKTKIGKTWVWADDYGWCGISCLAAQDYLRSINQPDAANSYLNLAEQCWQHMRDTGYDASDDATPVPHGCGNVSLDRKPIEGYGTKNTVTNVNLLLLSLRLYGATKNPDYLSMAYAQYKWFHTWNTIKYDSLDDGYYWRGRESVAPPYVLIHERPMAEKSYTKQDEPTWNPGWIWTGDQGLMISAMAELFLMRDDFRQFSDFDSEWVLLKCRRLVGGVEMFLFGADKVLREAPFDSSFIDDPGDYVGGRGVLLRYASEKAVQQARGFPFYLEAMRATAAAVWNSRDKQTKQFASLWNEAGDRAFNQSFVAAWGSGNPNTGSWGSAYDGVLQANGLDALTAGIRAG